jgi:isopenicillin-N epimerase
VREAVAVAARYFGGDVDDWVFCENATSAINSVLASLPLRGGDELLTTSHAYGAVLRAMRLWADRRGANTRIVEVPAVVESDSQIVDSIARALTAHTRLLIVDHITSPTATVFPVAEIVRRAHDAGVPVLVDGAHAAGQLALNVPEIGADWYTGNAHKWFFAPRGCGLLWTAPKWQAITRPAVLSHGTDQGYTAAFDWIGTRDVSPWLSMPKAAEAFGRFGGPALMARNRALADAAANHIAEQTNGLLTAPASMRPAMATVRLSQAADLVEAINVRRRLAERGFVIATNAFGGQLCIRISAQIYNDCVDYDRFADALLNLGIPLQ